ncbi:hypothetical protein QBZ16_001723 [Prototheca wickerhamii]|uniref:Uncharacterized protein n=1 Tax=Prototheca wickerhamii TaxID=3111 RepID=A0AAD9MIT8_PROWI|nr:hypothetical protein QBZ16_001723 [Prototheca wickerhamii]
MGSPDHPDVVVRLWWPRSLQHSRLQELFVHSCTVSRLHGLWLEADLHYCPGWGWLPAFKAAFAHGRSKRAQPDHAVIVLLSVAVLCLPTYTVVDTAAFAAFLRRYLAWLGSAHPAGKALLWVLRKGCGFKLHPQLCELLSGAGNAHAALLAALPAALATAFLRLAVALAACAALLHTPAEAARLLHASLAALSLLTAGLPRRAAAAAPDRPGARPALPWGLPAAAARLAASCLEAEGRGPGDAPVCFEVPTQRVLVTEDGAPISFRLARQEGWVAELRAAWRAGARRWWRDARAGTVDTRDLRAILAQFPARRRIDAPATSLAHLA